MSTLITTRPETVEDYKLLPETGPRYQLIEGELHRAPAPNRFHQDISRNLEEIFLGYLKEHPIGIIYHAPFDVYLDDKNVYQPDIIFVSKDRRHILTDSGAEGPPNLVVEVLSKRRRKIDETVKRKIFAQKGADEIWLIDPVATSIGIFDLQKDCQNPEVVFGPDAIFQRPMFPALAFDCKAIFRQPF